MTIVRLFVFFIKLSRSCLISRHCQWVFSECLERVDTNDEIVLTIKTRIT